MERIFRKYFFIFLSFTILFLLPKKMTEKIREQAIGVFTFSSKTGVSNRDNKEEEVQQMKLENVLLSEQIQQVGDFLSSEERIESQLKHLEMIRENLDDKQNENQKEFFLRREKHLLKRLKKQLMSLDGRVIYREPAFWSSYVWIDIGEQDNEAVKEKVVALNSPVVMGDVAIGVIDYVAKKKSRVKLITDTSLSLSARIVRGSLQNKVLLEQLQLIYDQLKIREDLFFSLPEQENALKLLMSLSENIKSSVHDRYLAKGEIRGSSSPLWRSRGQSLVGIGFNYDYDDAEGRSRDLRTGESKDKKIKAEVLLRQGDLLVTAGFDGIFPEGFILGLVEDVDSLEEGATFYNLKAKSLAPSYHELRSLTVLAPLQ